MQRIGTVEHLHILLSNENGLVTGLNKFGLFEESEKSGKPVGNKIYVNERLSKIHLLD